MHVTRHLMAILLITLLFPLTAMAYDVGEVAVIEDTFGLILPAEGMCDNMLYAQGLCVNHAGVAFYATHGDNYDILVIFTTKFLNPMFDVKMGFPIQSKVRGIGLEQGSLFHPSQLGSAGRLIHCVKMGALSDVPDDPNAYYRLPVITGIELLAHEIGHQWMAWITINIGDGRGNIPILRGFEGSSPNGHWSAWYNSGSVMYGGILTDNNNGTFTDCNGPRKYSNLDQYLMGIRPPEEVGELWYVDVDGSTEGNPSMPFSVSGCGNYTGTRVNFGIDAVIAANGVRNPAQSPCHLKLGFAIVHEVGLPPTLEQIAKVDRYRTALEAWWPWGTDNRGSLDTSLSGCGTGTAQCPGDPSPQCGVLPDGDSDKEPAEIIEEDTLVCTPGERRCNGDRLSLCHASGQMWVLEEDCALQGGSCVTDHCQYALPDGDETGDDDPAEVTDDAQDQAESLTCTPGSVRCQGSLIQKCDNAGQGWTLYTDCAPRACQNGACTSAGGDEDPDGQAATSSSGCNGGGLGGLLLLSVLVGRRWRRR